jgi:hypothetical protein
MKWKSLLLFALIFLAVTASGVSAKENRLPFLMNEDVGKAVTVVELYGLIEKMPESSIRKQKLFAELQKNLGLTENDFSAIANDPARVKLVAWDDTMAPLRIAALVPNSFEVDYWRNPNQGEIVVLFLLDDGWWPVVMLNCANPVITYAPQAPQKKQPSHDVPHDKYNGCEEVGYPYPHMSGRIGSYGVMLRGTGYYHEPPQFNSMGIPVKCSRDMFIENEEED